MAERIDKQDQILQVFQISNRAAKQIDPQVHAISKENLLIGVDRSSFVKEQAATYKQQNFLPSDYKLTAHDRGQIAKLHDWDAYHKFKSAITGFSHYCRAEFNVKDITADIKPSMVSSFLSELSDLGYSKNSVDGYISQIEKFGAFTNQDFHKETLAFKRSDEYKSLELKDTAPRAYAAPQRIINALGDLPSREVGGVMISEKTQLAASLSLNYGLRVGDSCHFKLIGNNQIFYNSKNGMKTVKTLAPQDYARAQQLSQNGRFDLSVNTIKDAWSRACKVAGVENNGIHGLRHNFCQNLYNDLRAKDLDHRET